MDAALKQISLEIPSSDISLVELIAERMGWKLNGSSNSSTVTAEDVARPQYSDRINRLRSLKGNGISQAEIDNDERLKYLLSK